VLVNNILSHTGNIIVDSKHFTGNTAIFRAVEYLLIGLLHLCQTLSITVENNFKTEVLRNLPGRK